MGRHKKVVPVVVTKEVDILISQVAAGLKTKEKNIEDIPIEKLLSLLIGLLKFKISLARSGQQSDDPTILKPGQTAEQAEEEALADLDELTKMVRRQVG